METLPAFSRIDEVQDFDDREIEARRSPLETGGALDIFLKAQDIAPVFGLQ